MEEVAQAVVGGHGAVHQGVDGPAQVGVAVVDAPGIVGAAAGVDLLHGVTEDILVVPASLLGDLHVGAVQGTQGHSAVEHQLHVAGAGSLGAGRRNLLGNVGGGDDVLGIGAVVVLDEDHLNLVSHGGIAVDHPGNPVDVADDGLGIHIAGSRLGAEDIGGGLEVGQTALLQTEVDVHNGQNVHQLALIQVQTLDLHIEHEVGVQHDALVLGDDMAQLLLLLPLDGVELGHGLVVDMVFQAPDQLQILQEVAAHLGADHLRQLRIAQAHPAAGGNAVGLVLEPLREGVVPILEAVVLQNLGVDLGDAVDVGANIHGQVGHMGHVVLDDEQVGMLALQLGIDLADDVHNLGHHAAQQIQRPLLQCLTHDGVVGVGEGLLRHLEGILKAHALQLQQPDQLGDGHSGVGIVQLYGIELAEAAQVAAMGNFEGPDHILQRRGGQDVLLLNTQALTVPGGIVGVQHTGDVLGLILGVQSPQVILRVEGVEVQLFLGLALPQTQGAHILGVIANDGHIVRHGQNGVIGELDLHGVVVAAVGPGITEFGPVVSLLHLVAVAVEALLEQAELIAQAVAGQGNVGGSGAVQEAGSQTAQAAVAQSIVLDILQNRQIHAPLGEQLLHLIQNAQIEQVAVDQTADQILGGNIVSLALMHTGLLGMAPVVGNRHHHRLTQSLMQLLGSGVLQGYVVSVLQLCFGPLQDVHTIQIHLFKPP